MKLTAPKIALSLLSMRIFADGSALNCLVYQAWSSVFQKDVIPLRHWKPQSVLWCTHEPLVLVHLLYSQSLLFMHPQRASTQDLCPLLESCFGYAHSLALSQALSLKHTLKTWRDKFHFSLCEQTLFLQLMFPFSIAWHITENHVMAALRCLFGICHWKTSTYQSLLNVLHLPFQQVNKYFIGLLFICTEMKQPDPFIRLQDAHPQQFVLEDKLTLGIQKPLKPESAVRETLLPFLQLIWLVRVCSHWTI